MQKGVAKLLPGHRPLEGERIKEVGAGSLLLQAAGLPNNLPLGRQMPGAEDLVQYQPLAGAQFQDSVLFFLGCAAALGGAGF